MNQTPAPSASARIAEARLLVRGLIVQAEVGVYAQEHGRRQPLVVEIELRIAPSAFEQIGDTVNYENLAAWARQVAESGHIKLVETFAHRLALLCMSEPKVLCARVRVDKPEALSPALAGVEIILQRP